MKSTVASIVGARPQFVKLAPLCRELARVGSIDHRILHTGQHYDYGMSRVFFDDLGIPPPAANLEIGSGPHGAQTGEMLRKIEEYLASESPRIVVVYGDTNSTLAGALAAAKLGIPVAHVEAGLRSYRKAMPEEINRVGTDHLSTVLLCPTVNAVDNLRREGFPEPLGGGTPWEDWGATARSIEHVPGIDRPLVVNVGDIMRDSMEMCLELAERTSGILGSMKLEPGRYCLATVHRAENTDDPARLAEIAAAFSESGQSIVFPAHPRCARAMRAHRISPGKNVRLVDPVGYLDMLVLEKNAQVVLTDSGGVQKEAYFLGVPCVTLRDETEWVETVVDGRNRLAGSSRGRILDALRSAAAMERRPGGDAFGRGDAAGRIALLLGHLVSAGAGAGPAV